MLSRLPFSSNFFSFYPACCHFFMEVWFICERQWKDIIPLYTIHSPKNSNTHVKLAFFVCSFWLTECYTIAVTYLTTKCKFYLWSLHLLLLYIHYVSLDIITYCSRLGLHVIHGVCVKTICFKILLACETQIMKMINNHHHHHMSTTFCPG